MRSILQTHEWAKFKASQDFEILELNGIFVHKRKLPLGKNFLYIPEVAASQITPGHIEEAKKLAKKLNSIFIRLEVVDKYSDNADKMIQAFGFVRAFEQVQPKWRQVIDISKSEDEILAQMKQKGRYNLRLAQRHDVKVESQNSKVTIESQKIKDFYSLYTETVKREKITGRTADYFQKMVDNFADTDYLEIFLATYQNKPVAAALVSYFDSVASYLYGGSSREHREVMAPYLMHWKIIQKAKERGCKSYDLLGRSAPEKQGKWSGVTKFKEQFGGEAVEILGSYDFVSQSFWYGLFKMAEKIRRKQDG